MNKYDATRRGLLGLAAVAVPGWLVARPTEASSRGAGAGHVRRVADRCMDAFDHGWQTGDWTPFLQTLTERFSFWFPEAPTRGRFSGVEGRRVIEEWARFHADHGNRITGRRRGVSVAGNRVFYEYESHGASELTATYRNWELIVVEVSGEKVSALHEYWGDARPTETAD